MSDEPKLDDLDARLRTVEMKRSIDVSPEPAATGLGGGMEMIGSVMVCGVVGALGDRAAGTTPWIMIVMILIGFVIGIYALWLGMNKRSR